MNGMDVVFPAEFVLVFLTGFKQGDCNSQRGCSGNAGQLRAGLFPDEVLHWAHERFQECGIGVRQQQTRSNQSGLVHGRCRNYSHHLPHTNRLV